MIKILLLYLKTAYIVAKKLGGLFIWSLDMDDFTGKFCEMGSFPLIKNRQANYYLIKMINISKISFFLVSIACHF